MQQIYEPPLRAKDIIVRLLTSPQFNDAEIADKVMNDERVREEVSRRPVKVSDVATLRHHLLRGKR